MPQMADMLAKRADNTTVNFTALVPSAGDGVSALWRAESIGTSPLYRPRLEIKTKSNGNKDARRIEIDLSVPYVETTVSASVIKANMPFKFVGTIPAMVPDSAVADAVAFAQSLLSQALVASVIKTGFAPT